MSGPADPTDTPLTDALALCWVRDQLVDSNLFAKVCLGRFHAPVGNGDFPNAWAYPVGFAETDDVDPYEPTRTLRYGVQIQVKPEDPDDEVGALRARRAVQLRRQPAHQRRPAGLDRGTHDDRGGPL